MQSQNQNQFREEFIMNKNDQQFAVQKIRTQYMEKTSTELDALRGLDAKVKRPAKVFAYAFGSVSAIIMGTGMSLVMTDIGTMIGMLTTFGDDTMMAIMRKGLLGATGGVISLLIVAMASYMIVVATEKLKQLKTEVNNG